VFVCENNHYAANNAIAVQHRVTDIAAHAHGYGRPGVTVDGNDVHAVYEATAQAVARARGGEGPTLLVCRTYRWYFHAMRNAPPPESRPAAEVAEWKGRDPVARLANELLARGTITAGDIEAMRDAVQRDLDDAVAFADASPFPDPAVVLDDMYAAPV
jgi:TPP-dependent pyruvate/acetoin dehydrogenase alpha subunit